MKLDLQYRDTDYFNTEDDYICYDPSLLRILVTKVEASGNIWYCKEKFRYKCSSVKMINFKEIYGQPISLKGIEYPGKFVKVLAPDNFGIVWNSGKHIKTHGLANFWTEWYKLYFDVQ